MTPVPSPAGAYGRVIGYVHRAAPAETSGAQFEVLREAGCRQIVEEIATDTHRVRPLLSKLLQELRSRDLLVVLSLDQLAWSAAGLLEVVEHLEARGAYLRSLSDGIDTAAAGRLPATLWVRALVRFEKAVSAERTKAGIEAAKAAGRLGGNPGLRSRHPEAIRAVVAGRGRAHKERLLEGAEHWLPTVERLRPQHSWREVTRILNHKGQSWTIEKLRRAVHRLVQEGIVPNDLVAHAPRRPPEDRLMTLVAGVAVSHPEFSLREIAAELERMGERTSRGRRQWAASSVKAFLDRAQRLGLTVPRPSED
jgi:DNA invertase Pin-like site-specific DNA recombinase